MRASLTWALRAAGLCCAVALAFNFGPVRAAAGLGSTIDSSHFDRTCKPCDDFFQFVNGGWMAQNPIPPQYPWWGSYLKMRDDVRGELREILERTIAAQPAHGTDEQKLGDFYASCMDAAAVESAGIAPIRPLLDLASHADAANLADTLAQLHAAGVNVFFRLNAVPDFKNSTQMVAFFQQGGLGLPERDYYTRTDEKSKAVLSAYQAHVGRMLELLGDSHDSSLSEAAKIVRFETSLANAQFTIVQRRNPENLYHKMALAQANGLAPPLQLPAYLKDAGVGNVEPVVVAETAYFQALSTQLQALSTNDLHAYLRWHVVHTYANALGSAFVTENWSFYNKELQGAKEQLPRWNRCVLSTDANLGYALGRLFVEKYFPPEAKAQVLEMVGNIKATLHDDLTTMDWMSTQTRAQAIKKLDAFTVKIGYPNKWRDYSKLDVERGSYAANLIAATRFETNRELGKIGHRVDRAEWHMTPPTVNAYYSSLNNEIVFPAGYLQPPMFDKDADTAVNYGAIGATIGHESTHGFDDSGRKFDGNGNLNNWWTKEDAERFNARAKCLVEQWDALEPLPGLHENGKQTLGENIADLGGVVIAYKAFERWQSRHPRQIIEGYTPEQRFFIGYAVGHLAYGTPEFTRFLTQADVHGFDKFRVNAAVADLPEFAAAFGCKAGDKEVRAKSEQCRIW